MPPSLNKPRPSALSSFGRDLRYFFFYQRKYVKRCRKSKGGINQGYLLLIWKIRKFRPENRAVSLHHFIWEASKSSSVQKVWAVISGTSIFHFFLVFSADSGILYSGSFSHNVKFYSFMFIQENSTRVVCVNGLHPGKPGVKSRSQRTKKLHGNC